MKTSYTRKLSFNERFYLANNIITPPFCNQIIYEGTGVFDHEKWTRAVAIASQANPGSRVVLKGALSFSKWVDSGESPRVRSVDGSTWDGTSGDGAQFLQDQLDPVKGPSCEVVLVRGSILRVVFRSHHAVMDGRGTIWWAEEIFRVLRGEEPLGSDSTLTDFELAMSLNSEGRFPPPQEFIAPTGKADLKESGIIWRRIKLEGKFRNFLPQVAILVAREARRHNSGKVRLAIPVDLRQRMPGIKSTANLANTIYIEVPEDASVESVSGEIKWQLDNLYDCRMYHKEKAMNHVPVWLITHEMKKIIRQRHREGLYHNSGVISNLGRINFDKFHGAGFNATSWFAIPPGQEIVPFFIGLAGSPEFANFMVSMPGVLASNGRLDEFIDRISSGLNAEKD